MDPPADDSPQQGEPSDGPDLSGLPGVSVNSSDAVVVESHSADPESTPGERRGRRRAVNSTRWWASVVLILALTIAALYAGVVVWGRVWDKQNGARTLASGTASTGNGERRWSAGVSNVMRCFTGTADCVDVDFNDGNYPQSGEYATEQYAVPGVRRGGVEVTETESGVRLAFTSKTGRVTVIRLYGDDLESQMNDYVLHDAHDGGAFFDWGPYPSDGPAAYVFACLQIAAALMMIVTIPVLLIAVIVQVARRRSIGRGVLCALAVVECVFLVLTVVLGVLEIPSYYSSATRPSEDAAETEWCSFTSPDGQYVLDAALVADATVQSDYVTAQYEQSDYPTRPVRFRIGRADAADSTAVTVMMRVETDYECRVDWSDDHVAIGTSKQRQGSNVPATLFRVYWADNGL